MTEVSLCGHSFLKTFLCLDCGQHNAKSIIHECIFVHFFKNCTLVLFSYKSTDEKWNNVANMLATFINYAQLFNIVLEKLVSKSYLRVSYLRVISCKRAIDKPFVQ